MKRVLGAAAALLLLGGALGAGRLSVVWMGRQPDGSFMVSRGRRIEPGAIAFDGHRTVSMAISPYTRRRFVDSSLYTTVSMLRSIELMLGLDPKNRFDALTPPLAACFTDRPDLTPYQARPNRVALDDMNPPLTAQRGKERYWTERSLALDWSGLDRPDPVVLNPVIWHSLHGVDTPYPVRD